MDVVGIVVHTKERDAFYSYGGKISFLLCSCTYQPSNLTVKASKVAFFFYQCLFLEQLCSCPYIVPPQPGLVGKFREVTVSLHLK